MNNLKFKNDPKDQEFFRELKRRVNQYFKTNEIEKSGNSTSKAKAVLLFTLYIICFISIFYTSTLASLFLAFGILGILTIFLALNVAHDAAHGTFTSNKKLNNLLVYTFDFLGANGYLWKMKHVHSHHPHVNIPNMDGDIKQTNNIVRIFPNSPFFNYHRYQFIYMPFLYLLYTLIWLLFRDFKDFLRPDVSGKDVITHDAKESAVFIIGKTFFLFRMIALPFIILNFSLPQILIAFLIFHFCASATVALALISAHIGEHSVYPEPNKNGQMNDSWVRHQIITTSDFATNSFVLTHLFGSFNHHIIHHLFPNICHIHYPPLTKILKQTCEEYNMPYNENPRLWDAMLSHFEFLKIRSKQELAVPYIEM